MDTDFNSIIESLEPDWNGFIDRLLSSVEGGWTEYYKENTPTLLLNIFTDETIQIYQKLAIVKYINRDNICCIGPGGTGKSYVISIIKSICKDGTCLFLAPTGMAALNMDTELGRTIHSIFKNGEKSLLAYNWQKCKKSILKKKEHIKKLLDNVHTIIFDEFSMIISGLLTTLVKMYSIIYDNDSRYPFSGKQIIFCGDPLQLPPVKNLEDPYLFENLNQRRILEDDDYIVTDDYFKTLFSRGNILHFNHNFRSNDPVFSELLFNARSGFNLCDDETTEKCLQLLNTRRRSGENINKNSEYFDNQLYDIYNDSLKSTLKNDIVDEINDKEINQLISTNPHFIYKRELLCSLNEFRQINPMVKNPDELYNAIVKYMDSLNGYKTKFIAVVGERVMLRVNNLDPRLKNGSLGTITEIDENECTIKVIFDNVGELNVPMNTWTHPEYSYMKVKSFPLIPAWAITIHKLQGQSISSKMFILLNGCDMMKFPHLLYTAISRMTDINNLYIIYNGVIVKEHFPVSNIMYDWYINNI